VFYLADKDRLQSVMKSIQGKQHRNTKENDRSQDDWEQVSKRRVFCRNRLESSGWVVWKYTES